MNIPLSRLTLVVSLSLIGFQALPAFSQAVDAPAMPAPEKGQATEKPAELPTTMIRALQGRVVSSLVTMGQIQKDLDRMDKSVSELSKFLQDTMINVSYPVLLPAVTTQPITLATPNFQIYSGRFPEPRTKYIVSSVVNIGNLLTLVGEDLNSIEIPPDKQDALMPLVTDAHDTMNAVIKDYAVLYGQIVSGPTVDAELLASKLLDMKKYNATIDQDLKAIFRIINLQNATPQMISFVVGLNKFDRDAQWLSTIAEYLRDSSKQLSPLAAFVNDAEDQGWMVLGPSLKQYAEIERSPYEKIQLEQLKKRMNELSDYTEAVQADLKALPQVNDPKAESIVNQISGLVADAAQHFQNLKNTLSTPVDKNFGSIIYREAQAIVDDMQQADKLEHQVSDKIVGSSSVF